MSLATRPVASVPNDLAAFWVPFTPNRAFKKAPRLIARAKDMHYYTVDGKAVIDGSAGMWCCNAGHNRARIVEAIQQPGRRARLSAGISVFASEGVRARKPHRGARAGRSRPRVLLQFGLRGGRHRAQGRARLPQCARRSLARAADRARARLSRRRLRRHLGRRHRGEPEDVRHHAGGRRPPVAHLQPRAAGLHQGRARMGRASRRRSRPHRRAARRLHHRGGDRRADGGLDRRAAAAERLSGAAARDLRQARHPADLRRGDHRLRPARPRIRGRALRRDPGHDHLCQGRHLRHGADGGRDRAQGHLRRVHARPRARDRAVPRLHLLGPSRSPARPASRRSTSIATRSCSSAPPRWKANGPTRRCR